MSRELQEKEPVATCSALCTDTRGSAAVIAPCSAWLFPSRLSLDPSKLQRLFDSGCWPLSLSLFSCLCCPAECPTSQGALIKSMQSLPPGPGGPSEVPCPQRLQPRGCGRQCGSGIRCTGSQSRLQH